MIVDTAGRLHTQEHLMEELSKVRRVIAQRLDGAPHETLLTIDATTGQNGLQQARLFTQAADVTGLVLTKLDGSAKGGIAIAIAHELGIPIKLIGIGESARGSAPVRRRGVRTRAVLGMTGPQRAACIIQQSKWRRHPFPTRRSENVSPRRVVQVRVRARRVASLRMRGAG